MESKDLQVALEFIKMLTARLENPAAFARQLSLLSGALAADPIPAEDCEAFLRGWITSCCMNGILKLKAAGPEPLVN